MQGFSLERLTPLLLLVLQFSCCLIDTSLAARNPRQGGSGGGGKNGRAERYRGSQQAARKRHNGAGGNGLGGVNGIGSAVMAQNHENNHTEFVKGKSKCEYLFFNKMKKWNKNFSKKFELKTK
uniref:Uncharacterized protein n=1 Tax=Ceratitis capitata TaxID=7213 RepID=W8ASA3_CERCA